MLCIVWTQYSAVHHTLWWARSQSCWEVWHLPHFHCLCGSTLLVAYPVLHTNLSLKKGNGEKTILAWRREMERKHDLGCEVEEEGMWLARAVLLQSHSNRHISCVFNALPHLYFDVCIAVYECCKALDTFISLASTSDSRLLMLIIRMVQSSERPLIG